MSPLFVSSLSDCDWLIDWSYSFSLSHYSIVSKNIIDLHEGSICVYSAGMGHGCTFSIELPIIVDQPLDFDVNNKLIFETNDNTSFTELIIPEDDNFNNYINSNGSERIKLSPLVRLSSKLSNNSIIVDSESEHGNTKIKALIVDDSSMNRKMVRRLLEMKGNRDDNDYNGYDDDNSYDNDDDDDNNCHWP